MMITNVIRRSRQVSVLCVCALFVLVAFAHRADAQRGDVPPIVIPYATPDLVVGVNVPAKLMPSDQGPIEITVDNTLTAVRSTPVGDIMGGSAVKDQQSGCRGDGLVRLHLLIHSNPLGARSATIRVRPPSRPFLLRSRSLIHG